MEIFNPLVKQKAMFESKSFDINALAPPTDLRRVNKYAKTVKLNSAALGDGGSHELDVNAWLPLAAPVYNISPNIQDYVIVPIPAMITGLPNTNGDSATTAEMLKFNPTHGQPAYKTWKGKPTFIEHDNQDHTKAKGIILDSYLRPLPGFKGDHARLMLLLAFDRTRDPELAAKILSREMNTYSIGMFYNSYRCSVCSHDVHQKTMQLCSHTKINHPTYMHTSQTLCYRLCKNIVGFECSSVGDPAFVSALNRPEHVMDPRKLY